MSRNLANTASNSHEDCATVNEALEEGWKRGIAHAMAGNIITQAEEAKLQDRLVLDSAASPKAAPQLNTNGSKARGRINC